MQWATRLCCALLLTTAQYGYGRWQPYTIVWEIPVLSGQLAVWYHEVLFSCQLLCHTSVLANYLPDAFSMVVFQHCRYILYATFRLDCILSLFVVICSTNCYAKLVSSPELLKDPNMFCKVSTTRFSYHFPSFICCSRTPISNIQLPERIAVGTIRSRNPTL